MDQEQFVKLSSSKILITGGAGFIGSNLCEKLLEVGARVVCLDNFATGKKENLAAFIDDPHFTLIEGDIRDAEVCKKQVKEWTTSCTRQPSGRFQGH
jgi:UDP-N-acetylglucosamine/UDP-N-acetylgalactosamine 4-epimerase